MWKGAPPVILQTPPKGESCEIGGAHASKNRTSVYRGAQVGGRRCVWCVSPPTRWPRSLGTWGLRPTCCIAGPLSTGRPRSTEPHGPMSSMLRGAAEVCPLPDLSVAEGALLLVEEGMACPMDGTTMCPPSLTSSPERQIKHNLVSDVDHATSLLGSAAVLTVSLAPTLWSWGSAYSIVPISIGSPSVLRI